MWCTTALQQPRAFFRHQQDQSTGCPYYCDLWHQVWGGPRSSTYIWHKLIPSGAKCKFAVQEASDVGSSIFVFSLLSRLCLVVFGSVTCHMSLQVMPVVCQIELSLHRWMCWITVKTICLNLWPFLNPHTWQFCDALQIRMSPTVLYALANTCDLWLMVDMPYSGHRVPVNLN